MSDLHCDQGIVLSELPLKVTWERAVLQVSVFLSQLNMRTVSPLALERIAVLNIDKYLADVFEPCYIKSIISFKL